MKKLLKTLLVSALLTLSAVPAHAATCSVSEFTTVARDFGGQLLTIPMLGNPSPTTQTVTATTPTAVSNAFQTSTRYLWIYCDEVMHMQIGVTPATGLTTGDMRIPAGGFWVGLPRIDVDLGTLKIAFCDADCT